MWHNVKSKMGKIAAISLTAASLVSVSTNAAAATSVDELPISAELRQLIMAAITAPATAPGIAQSSPVGFGASWGDVFVGIGGSQNEKSNRVNDEVNGSAAIGFGLGDPSKYVGLETTVNIISLTGGANESEFGEDGNVNFKLHRVINATTSVAIGIENAVAWGRPDNADNSKYIAISHVTSLRPSNPSSPLTLVVTAGVGDTRFKDQTEAAAQLANDNAINPFAAVSLAVTRRAAVIADWNGSTLGLGVSFIPFRNIPLSASVGVVDASDRLNEGVRYTAGIGYSYNFAK